MNRFLRDLIGIGKAFGLEYLGHDGADHHAFGKDGKIMIRAPGTPANDGLALTRFRTRCSKLDHDETPRLKPESIDGNEAFRRLGAGRSDP